VRKTNCDHLCPPGSDKHLLIRLDAPGLRVEWVHFHIDMVRIKLLSTADFPVRACVYHVMMCRAPLTAETGFPYPEAPADHGAPRTGISLFGPDDKIARPQTNASVVQSRSLIRGMNDLHARKSVRGIRQRPLDSWRVIDHLLIANARDLTRLTTRQLFQNLEHRFW
jgi:hypothetical protein